MQRRQHGTRSLAAPARGKRSGSANWGRLGSGQLVVTYEGNDTTAPSVLSGSPTGELPMGTTSVVLEVATDETATCRYGTAAGYPFERMTGRFDTPDGLTHSASLSGLG